MTETLSTLSREQLQKLVQYAINEDPGGILGKVFRRIGNVIHTVELQGFITIKICSREVVRANDR